MHLGNSTPPPDDAEIVRSLMDRKDRGLQMLLHKHGGTIRKLLKRSMANQLGESELDDVMSTAAFHSWKRADSFDPDRGTLRAWFYVIARNAALDVLRDRASRSWQQTEEHLDLHAATDKAADGTADDNGAEAAEPPPPPTFVAALQQCIRKLPRLQRGIIEADLRSGDVANATELARRYRTSVNSIYVSRSNARKALRRGLQELGFEDGDSKEASWA